MFKRSRRKIILSIMAPFVLLFIISLCAILFTSYHGLQRDHTDMLERYTQSWSLTRQSAEQKNDDLTERDGTNPAEQGGTNPAGQDGTDPAGQNGADPAEQGSAKPDGKDNGRQPKELQNYALSTFYSVAVADDGTVLAVDDGNRTFYSEEDLTALAEKILAAGKETGKSGDLTYQVLDRDGYTLIAFIDNTVADNSWETLLRNFVIIGCVAIVILFFFALWLSARIIRPLEENDRKQKQFISDASHELKTPVAAISANAELLSRELGHNDWLDNIQYENERMGGLVKQLLNLSRAENAETALEPTDLSRLVTGEELALESVAFEQGKTILCDIEDGITVTGSPQQLTQLVSILLDNAIRYSTGPEINLSLKRQNRAVLLSVSNDCEEIPADKLAHLFDRFYRVDEARGGDEAHYGLGLSIAKAVAEKHGGKISVKCENGRACFTVCLPQKN